MKINWDNLEGMFLTKKGNLKKGRNLYIEKDSCKNCGDPYLTHKHNPGDYCDFSCANSGENNPMYGKEGYWAGKYGEDHHFYGKEHSEETKKKIGESNKGKYCGENSPWYGVRKYGKDNPNWRGDKCITPESTRIRESQEYKLWRTAVYERDNYTCQMCNTRGGNLQAHHIFEFSKYKVLRFEVYNGQTLCKGCHDTTKGKELQHRINIVKSIFQEEKLNEREQGE